MTITNNLFTNHVGKNSEKITSLYNEFDEKRFNGKEKRLLALKEKFLVEVERNGN
jgi:hypothetical protein